MTLVTPATRPVTPLTPLWPHWPPLWLLWPLDHCHPINPSIDPPLTPVTFVSAYSEAGSSSIRASPISYQSKLTLFLLSLLYPCVIPVLSQLVPYYALFCSQASIATPIAFHQSQTSVITTGPPVNLPPNTPYYHHIPVFICVVQGLIMFPIAVVVFNYMALELNGVPTVPVLVIFMTALGPTSLLFPCVLLRLAYYVCMSCVWLSMCRLYMPFVCRVYNIVSVCACLCRWASRRRCSRLYAVCSPFVCRLYTFCTPFVHRLYTVCTPFVHRLYAVCTPFVRCLYAVCM